MKTILRATFIIGLSMFAGIVSGQNAANQLTKEETKQGWKSLFDGSTSTGWTKSNGQPFPEKG